MLRKRWFIRMGEADTALPLAGVIGRGAMAR